MEKDVAIRIKGEALLAVEHLMAALRIAENELSRDEFEEVKKGVGMAIGAIEMRVNVPLYTKHPDLED